MNLEQNWDLTLTWVGRGGEGRFYLPPSWFSFNNSKTVKAVTLEICSIQWNSIRNIRAKFGIHNSPQSPGIGQNSDGGISDFRISGQSFTKENCHNLRTCDDIDMKLGPVTKFDKRNKTTSKKLTMTSCQKIVMSLLFFWFLAKLEQSRYRIPDTESAKVMFLVIATFFLTKLKIELKHPKHSFHTITLRKGTFMDKKHKFFEKMLTSAKLRLPRH